MKKLLVITMVIAVIATVAAYALTPVNDAATMTGGAITWTNSRSYAVMKLTSCEIFAAVPTAQTITVRRVRSTRTNTVGTIGMSAGIGTLSATGTIYLFKSDILLFNSDNATGACNAEITGELYP